jgi:hypothetical protein
MINRLAGCRSLAELASAQRDVAREHLELTISELQQLTARSIQFSADRPATRPATAPVLAIVGEEFLCRDSVARSGRSLIVRW